MGSGQGEFVPIPAMFMRGGTSKGIYLMADDLPRDPLIRDQVILDIYGSPDERQINGMGGADPLTSKVAILEVSRRPGVHIDYTFGYVGIKDAVIDYDGNCGNISSGVGVFAIRKGLVAPVEPETKVVIYNTNTNKVIESLIPVRDGEVVFEGEYSISGVPGTGAKIVMNFPNSAGSKTGKLLPTGNVRDRIRLSDGRRLDVSLVDAANPCVFFRAEEAGFNGRELPADCERDPRLLATLDEVRRIAGVMMGLAPSPDKVGPAVPKAAFVAPPQDYVGSDGRPVSAREVDFLGRYQALAVMHKTYAVTGGIAAAAAAKIEGTVVNEVARKDADLEEIRIGHPSGVLEIFADIRAMPGPTWELLRAGVSRTAKPIMDGFVYASRRAFQPKARP